MGTKTITIMEDAYDLLKSKKTASESFSEVLRRELKTSKRSITEFAGKWNFLDKEDIKKIKTVIKKSRDYSYKYRKEKLNL